MSSIFTKIINGEIPSYKIADNDQFIAILDAFPLVRGHVLVIPKKETDKLFDLNKEEYSQIMNFSYDIAKALERAIPCKRVGISVIGLEVPHVHVHLVPLNTIDDINFSRPKIKVSEEEMNTITQLIISQL